MKEDGYFFWCPPEECFYSGYKVPPKINNALWVEMEIQIPGNPQLCIWEPGTSRLPDLSSLAAKLCYPSGILNIHAYKVRDLGKVKKKVYHKG